LRSWLSLCAVVLLVAACDREVPTEAGAGLLPPGALQTFEVVLEPHRYLVLDTAFGLYTDPRDAPFVVLASQFDGGLTSHALVRFSIPTVLSVPDTAGVARADSLFQYMSGRIRVLLDTSAVSSQQVQVAVYHTGEAWDASATWTNRVDTAGVRLPWATPGGTRAELVTRTTVQLRDTLDIPVDSAAIARWSEIADGSRGALIIIETPGVRIRTSLPALHLQARPSIRPDTLIDAVAPAPLHTWLTTPEQPASTGEPRVGGTPAWRTIYRLRDRLDTLTFACPGTPNCRVQLGRAHINFAALRLQPTVTPAGYRPEFDLVVGAFLLLPSPQVPLQRSPLGDVTGIATVPASSFAAPAGPVVELTVTDLIRTASLPASERGDLYLPTHFALGPGEPRTFGFGTFQTMPPLRLVLSVARELVLP
jgi:hypothetical protein